MEACINSRNKRLRDESNDSLFNFIGSKFLRLDSDELNLISPHLDDRDPPISSDSSDSESIHADDPALDSSVQEDLLKILEEADTSIDRDSAIQDLDSVIRSFEEEIQVPVPVQPDLGYLLEASDDELGLPPAGQRGEIEAEAEAEAVNFAAEFEDEVTDYCWLENLSSENESNLAEEEVVALGGLFDLMDDTAELPPSPPPYRSETMYCL